MRQSKRYGTRTSLYEENEDRRVKCPEWSFSQGFLNRLQEGADINKVSKSRYFESVVQNFFILENPNIIVFSKRDYNSNDKKKSPKLTIHPQILEDIKEYASKSSPSESKYLELLFTKYYTKYKHEIELKNLIKFL